MNFQHELDGKLYAGGTVKVLPNSHDGEMMQALRMKELAQELFLWLGTEDQIEITDKTSSYGLAHKLGLSPDQEYEFLQILNESDRQLFLIEHLERMIPALEKAELARERIRLNGHFKHLDPLKF